MNIKLDKCDWATIAVALEDASFNRRANADHQEAMILPGCAVREALKLAADDRDAADYLDGLARKIREVM